MSDNVYILGVGMIKFGKYLQKSIRDMTGEALETVLKDCGLAREDIQAAWFSNAYWGLFSDQHGIRGQVALSANGVQGIPVINVENACASGSTALHGAWMSVKAGLYDCVLAIGAEKLYNEDRQKSIDSFIASTDVEKTKRDIAMWIEQEKQKREKEAKEKGTSPEEVKIGDHSVFMDFYAWDTRAHMDKYGTTQKQLAIIAAKSHNNSALNPLAQYTFTTTVEQVLNDRLVAYPLTRSMCAPIGDGAAAAIVCSENFLKKNPSNRAVKIRASVLEGGRRTGIRDIGARASKRAYSTAGVGPDDIDIMEVHDASVFGEISNLELMGICKPGEGGILAERGDTALTGRIPVNTSGGLVSRGHPLGASGLAQIHELVTQLRGEAGERQIKKHRIAMAENGGGTLGLDEAAMGVHILEKP